MSAGSLPPSLPAVLQEQFGELQNKRLKLDFSRGNPSPEQLVLSESMLEIKDVISPRGVDCRNYGHPFGFPEAREWFAKYLNTGDPDLVLCGGNSSVDLMARFLECALGYPLSGTEKPWSIRIAPKFLCPVPGYDRHHILCQELGFGMIPVSAGENGLNVTWVETFLDASLEDIKGLWCVPKYSNPTGACYSLEMIERLAVMDAQPDFRIIFDLAYWAHDVLVPPVFGPNILEIFARAGNPDRAVLFASLSKVTFANGSVSAFAGSRANVEWFEKHLKARTTGFDKINMLRHMLFLPTMKDVLGHMEKHRAILQPKLEIILETLDREFPRISQSYIDWTRPDGGYFVSLETLEGCAKRAVEVTNMLGVLFTAGNTFTYGIDPKDTNIRIPFSFHTHDELRSAMEALALGIKIATWEKYGIS